MRISRPAWRCEGYNQPLERERLPRHSAVPTSSSSLTQPSSRRKNSGAQLKGREAPQLDKHGPCVTIPVCAQEGDFWGVWGGGERWLWEQRRGQAPRAFCSMYSAHSSQSDLLQSQSSVPACGASQHAGGPPHGRVNCQARLHESTRPSYKTNKGVTGPTPSGNLFNRAGLREMCRTPAAPRRLAHWRADGRINPVVRLDMGKSRLHKALCSLKRDTCTRARCVKAVDELAHVKKRNETAMWQHLGKGVLHRVGTNKTLTMEGSTVACFAQTDELYLLSLIFPFQQRNNALQTPVDSGDNRRCFSAYCKGATAQTTGSSTVREINDWKLFAATSLLGVWFVSMLITKCPALLINFQPPVDSTKVKCVLESNIPQQPENSWDSFHHIRAGV